ncbi:hypothetical protein [Methylovirgula sp. HY1]|uniref:NADH-quinone oxidoreductase subunit B family protein n=1 Tax=Methylovirgula sp. HY1 TaxID=2822761 RepID=UPI001C771083|nr:hypothetical protein [Methylovirgula sp. HY1]QXX74925.1 Periplasmic [NiFe] hydrogenase small subunit [Methylovirgula sp. HY1]
MANLLWLQGGACSGNTMSFLNAEEPSACDLVTDFGINVLWHPSLGLELGDNVKTLLQDCVSGKIPLDIFVFEGTVVNAPNGSGNWNRFCGRPMKDWVKELSDAAQFVVAIGDCATWGGIPAMAPNPSESVGLQFLKRDAGGSLGTGFKSKAGLPVINIPGCPAHPDWVTQILVAAASGRGGGHRFHQSVSRVAGRGLAFRDPARCGSGWWCGSVYGCRQGRSSQPGQAPGQRLR